jgi:dihydrodipicolinate synthase/N-acetylneuraminate lyase
VTDRKQGPAGIFPPITTPFDPATGDIAPVQFRQNIERLLAQGVDGVVVSGSTGESPLLDPDE